MTDEAQELLSKIAMDTSLRYAMHMIITASLCCQKRKATEVDVDDIKKVYGLFVDVKRSTKFLQDYQDEFLYSDERNELEEDDA